ncbi:MAG: four helix bundle protein [Candidatus Omnitrophica bacterium]|nr:four helix bundle protein [Candidatus Omnitrophota bacterium]
MATLKRFEDIEAWKKARVLTKKVYAVSKNGSFAKDFALRDQIRTAAISIMANIAEGFERGGSKEFIQFLSMAKASSAEVRSHLYVTLDQSYLDESTFRELYSLSNEINRIISGLMSYLSDSKVKGRKFK